MRKLLRGWRGQFVWEWSYLFRTKMFYLTGCHIGLEAGSYKGEYVELVVIILGVGFYVEWYPPTDGREEFVGEMNERIAEVKKQFGITEGDDEQAACE